LLCVLMPADHDLTADRHLLERDACARGGRFLRRLLVGAAQPARTGQRRALGHTRKRFAEALPPRDIVAHTGSRSRSADRITISITSSTVRSTFAFSTTRTLSRRARPTMYVWMRRMSSRRARYLSIARIPPVVTSRTWK